MIQADDDVGRVASGATFGIGPSPARRPRTGAVRHAMSFAPEPAAGKPRLIARARMPRRAVIPARACELLVHRLLTAAVARARERHASVVSAAHLYVRRCMLPTLALLPARLLKLRSVACSSDPSGPSAMRSKYAVAQDDKLDFLRDVFSQVPDPSELTHADDADEAQSRCVRWTATCCVGRLSCACRCIAGTTDISLPTRPLTLACDDTDSASETRKPIKVPRRRVPLTTHRISPLARAVAVAEAEAEAAAGDEGEGEVAGRRPRHLPHCR